MIAELKPYAEYKESGNPWFPQSPVHWDVSRLKSRLTRNDAGVWTDNSSDSGTITLRSTEQTVDGHWKIKDPARLNLSASQRSAALLMSGDLVVTKSSGSPDHIGKTTLVDDAVEKMECCFSNFMQRLRPRGDVNPRLLWWLLNSAIGRQQFVYRTTTTTGLGNLNGTILGLCVFPFPPPAEQSAIVRFLDHWNGRLEKAIRAKRRVIALLQEQKQAIIHRAVTRGLDPNVKLKDSGIPWLGEIPEHWEVRRLKFLTHIKTGGRDTKDRVDDGPYPFFVRSQTVERIDSYSFDGEAVLTAGDGAGVGKVFHYIKGKFEYHQRVYKFSNFRGIFGLFFFNYFKSCLKFEALDASAKSTVDSLRLPLLQNFATVIPPISEQQEIVGRIASEVAPLDLAITRYEREIALLREYRTRLTADVVTGKLDVRAAAAKLPEISEGTPLEADGDDATEELEEVEA